MFIPYKTCECGEKLVSRYWYLLHLKSCSVAKSNKPPDSVNKPDAVDKPINSAYKPRRKTFFKTCVCENEFMTKTSYYKHLKWCPIKTSRTPTGNYVCIEGDCSFHTKLSDDFLQHLKDIHPNKNIFNTYSVDKPPDDVDKPIDSADKPPRKTFFKTCVCEKELSTKISYYKHLKCCSITTSAAPTGNYVCIEGDCSFHTKLSDDFLQHLKDIHPNKKFFKTYSADKPIESVNKPIESVNKPPDAVDKPIDSADKPPRKTFFKTCVCEKEFLTKISYYKHLKCCPITTSGAQTGNYVCVEGDCSFHTKLSDDFLQHLKDIHPNQKFFKTYSVDKPPDAVDKHPRKKLFKTYSVDKPIESVDKPIESVDKPIESVDKPIESVDTPIEFVDKPIESVDKHLESVDKPPDAVDKPIDSADKPPRKTFFKTCVCEKEFSTETNYYKHLKCCPITTSGAPTGNYVCLEGDCSFHTELSNVFLQHLKDIHPKKRFFITYYVNKPIESVDKPPDAVDKHLESVDKPPDAVDKPIDSADKPPRKTFFKTCVCEKEFTIEASYDKHLKWCRIIKNRAPTGNYVCSERDCSFRAELSNDFLQHLKDIHPKKKFFKTCVCEREFESKVSYYFHLKKCTNAKSEAPAGSYVCLEGDCSFRAKLSDYFLQHLKNVHNKEPVKDVKIFQNYSDFKSWLQNFEKEEKVSFVPRSYRKSGCQKRVYYYCNRSGKSVSRSNGVRRPRVKGSRKMGFTCPASIQVVVSADSPLVTVNIKNLHYGHDRDPNHVNIPKEDRERIKMEKLLRPKRIRRKKIPTENIPGENVNNTEKKVRKRKRKVLTERIPEEKLNIEILYEALCLPINNTEEVKNDLILKMSQLKELIETCDNEDILLASRQHIDNALNVFNYVELR